MKSGATLKYCLKLRGMLALFPAAWRETFLKHPETPALALPLGGICPRTARGQVPSVLPLCGTDVAGAGAADSSSQGPALESEQEPDRRRQGPGVQEAGACPAVSAVSAGTGSPAVAAGSAEPAFLNWQNCFGNVFLLFPQRAAVLQACAPPCHLPGPGLRRSGLKLAERSVSSRSGVPAACSLAGGRDRAGELCGSGMLFAFQIRALRSLAPPGLPESFPAWRPSADCRTFPISRSARAAPTHRHVLLKLRAWQPR